MMDDGREDWLEEKAPAMANLVRKTFGSKLSSNFEITGRGFAIHLARNLPDVVMELQVHKPDIDGTGY
jgi:hypothetical protein